MATPPVSSDALTHKSLASQMQTMYRSVETERDRLAREVSGLKAKLDRRYAEGYAAGSREGYARAMDTLTGAAAVKQATTEAKQEWTAERWPYKAGRPGCFHEDAEVVHQVGQLEMWRCSCGAQARDLDGKTLQP